MGQVMPPRRRRRQAAVVVLLALLLATALWPRELRSLYLLGLQATVVLGLSLLVLWPRRPRIRSAPDVAEAATATFVGREETLAAIAWRFTDVHASLPARM